MRITAEQLGAFENWAKGHRERTGQEGLVHPMEAFVAGWDVAFIVAACDAGDRLGTLEEALLAEFDGVKPNHAARVLARLEAAGFVLVRKPAPFNQGG